MNPMLVLLKLVRFSPRYSITCVVYATLLLCVLPLPIGLASQAYFDSLSLGAVGVLMALQLVETLVEPLLGNPWNSLQQKSHVLLQRNLFAEVLRGYGRHGLMVSVGEAISRFRDDPRVIGDGLDALCDLVGRTLFAVAAAIVMWGISPLLTAVLGLPLLLSAWLSEALGTRTLTYRTASQAATSRVTGFLGEVIGAHLALKVGGASAHAVAQLRELGEARRRMVVRDSVFDVLLDSSSVNLGHLGTGLVLLLGARAISDGTFSVGDFALFVVYLDQLVWYPAEIARLISDLKRIQVSYSRMTSIVPSAPAGALVAREPFQELSPSRQPLEKLELRHVSYVYPNSASGITDVSLTLYRGTSTVITGRIGSGKTTLLNVLLGLLPRTAGEILWNGQPVEAGFLVPPHAAYTPQVPRLFSETLRENVLLGRPNDREAVDGAVHAAVLEADVATLEHGLDARVGPRGVKLSGGQVQRAAAARMFLSGAELLVLDDVSSALDSDTEAELWSRLFARGRDITCLVVSHRPAALERADQVLVMDGGRLKIGRDVGSHGSRQLV